jgi:hypothetical protein
MSERRSKIVQIMSRANSHLRYWRYRRSIGKPISLLGSIGDWRRRFLFEWRNRRYL